MTVRLGTTKTEYTSNEKWDICLKLMIITSIRPIRISLLVVKATSEIENESSRLYVGLRKNMALSGIF
mgnify:CR=1 FL=1